VGDGGRGALARDLFDNLLGLLYVRNLDSGDDLGALRGLAAHWRALGRRVPIFAVNSEPVLKQRGEEQHSRLVHWRPGTRIDLEQPPYRLVQLE
jgi:hypothetical protein